MDEEALDVIADRGSMTQGKADSPRTKSYTRKCLLKKVVNPDFKSVAGGLGCAADQIEEFRNPTCR